MDPDPDRIRAFGERLGAMWGHERAHEMLTDAGFTDVRVFDTPSPQNCMYVCQAGTR